MTYIISTRQLTQDQVTNLTDRITKLLAPYEDRLRDGQSDGQDTQKVEDANKVSVECESFTIAEPQVSKSGQSLAFRTCDVKRFNTEVLEKLKAAITIVAGKEKKIEVMKDEKVEGYDLTSAQRKRIQKTIKDSS